MPLRNSRSWRQLYVVSCRFQCGVDGEGLLKRGPAPSGYIYDAYIDEQFETALIAAKAAAR